MRREDPESEKKAQCAENKETTNKLVIGFWHYGIILTYLSVIFAVVGMVFSASGRAYIGVGCLLGSGFCDAFDGVVARTRKNRTAADKLFGERIDSLSDLVAFGIAPVLIGVGMGLTQWYFLIVYSLYALAALVRLAYYDVTEQLRMKEENCEKRKYFDGFPVTNAAFILPFFYLVSTMFEGFLVPSVCMAIYYTGMGTAFVARFKMPKPGVKGVCVAIASSLITIAILLIVKFVILGQTL